MTTERTTTTLQSRIDELRSEMQGMLGENRLQRHLLRMELHDRFDQFERRHAELHAALGKARAETIDALRTSITELRRAFDEIRHEAAQPPRSMGTPGTATAPATPTAKPTRASGETEC